MRRMKLPLRRESFYDDALPHLPTVENPFLSGWLGRPVLACPLLSYPVLACPILADYPNPSLYLLSGTRLWSTEHIGAAGRALQLRLLWRINRVSLSLSLSLLLSLFPSLTPSRVQAVNFYWFQWARICTVIAQAGHGRTRLTRRATRQGAPA